MTTNKPPGVPQAAFGVASTALNDAMQAKDVDLEQATDAVVTALAAAGLINLRLSGEDPGARIRLREMLGAALWQKAGVVISPQVLDSVIVALVAAGWIRN